MLSKSYLRRQTLLPNSLFLARSWKVLSTQHRPSQTQTGPLMSPKSSGRQPGGSFGYFKYLMTLCVVKHYLEFGKSGFCSSLRIRDRFRRTASSARSSGGSHRPHTPPPRPRSRPRGGAHGGHGHGRALSGGCREGLGASRRRSTAGPGERTRPREQPQPGGGNAAGRCRASASASICCS